MPSMRRRERHQAFLMGITMAWMCVRNHHGHLLQGAAHCTGVCSSAAAVVLKEAAAFALWAGVILWEGRTERGPASLRVQKSISVES